MCGTSSQQQNAYDQAVSTQQTMNSDFNKVFAGNQNILSNLTASLNPIVAAGVGQFGFTPEETAAMRTGAKDQIASAGRAATGQTSEALAAMGGGNADLPSGSKAAIQGSLAEDQAQKQAQAQENITTAGYNQGRQNFFQANSQLASAPGELENPATAMEGGALSSTENLSKAADAITATNRAWEKPLLGGIGAGLDYFTKGLSGTAGKIGDAADSAVNSLGV